MKNEILEILNRNELVNPEKADLLEKLFKENIPEWVREAARVEEAEGKARNIHSSFPGGIELKYEL